MNVCMSRRLIPSKEWQRVGAWDDWRLIINSGVDSIRVSGEPDIYAVEDMTRIDLQAMKTFLLLWSDQVGIFKLINDHKDDGHVDMEDDPMGGVALHPSFWYPGERILILVWCAVLMHKTECNTNYLAEGDVFMSGSFWTVIYVW